MTCGLGTPEAIPIHASTLILTLRKKLIGIFRKLTFSCNLVPTLINHFSTDLKKKRFDEMGCYDIPAVIDYILTKTGRNTMSYVGKCRPLFNILTLAINIFCLTKATRWDARCFSFACLYVPN